MAKTITTYSANSKTKKPKSIPLPKEFAEPVNKALLAQAIHVYRDRRHAGLSKTMTRGEINITKAKIYRQKGTGNARHGASSAPIFVGGGKAHGPKGVKRVLELPKKMKRKALSSAWGAKHLAGKIAIVEGLGSIKSTKEAHDLIGKVVDGQGKEGWKKITLYLSGENAQVYRFFKNVEGLKVEKYSNANAYAVFFGGLIVVDQKVFEKPKAKPAKGAK